MSKRSSDIKTSSPIGRKFIYQYPRFGNGKYRTDDYRLWRRKAHLIKPTTKGVRWDRSVYYWWYEYLRRHEGYRQFCVTGEGTFSELYADFGDIHAYGDDFRSWFYEVGFDLFAERWLPADIVTADSIDALQASSAIDADSEYVYAAIPIGNSRKHLLREYDKVITRLKEQRKKDGKDTGSTARYPVARIPYVNSLANYLAVWDECQTGAPLAEVYERVFPPLSDAAIAKRSQRRLSSEAQIDRVRKQQYSNVVVRARNKANLLIANVAKGVFPSFDAD